jgi:hypothetical protein
MELLKWVFLIAGLTVWTTVVQLFSSLEPSIIFPFGSRAKNTSWHYVWKLTTNFRCRQRFLFRNDKASNQPANQKWQIIVVYSQMQILLKCAHICIELYILFWITFCDSLY